MDFKAQIEKLECTRNWTKWRRQVELLLRHNEVLELVVGERTAPEALQLVEQGVHQIKIFKFQEFPGIPKNFKQIPGILSYFFW